MRRDTSELVNGDHRPLNAICDGPFAHILIGDRSGVLDVMRKKSLVSSTRFENTRGFAAKGNLQIVKTCVSCVKFGRVHPGGISRRSVIGLD